MTLQSSEQRQQEWRDPLQVASHWQEAPIIDPSLFRHRVSGSWWETLDRAGVTLIVTREYEHLLLALTVVSGKPYCTYFRLPHPSGIAFDCLRRELHVASTRNPNQIVSFLPVTNSLSRGDAQRPSVESKPLIPRSTSFLPGCFYLHDLAMIGGTLHANSVGQNTVVRLDGASAEAVWWPRSMERDGTPIVDRNYIQLNSIAAGSSVEGSFFSASSVQPEHRRPGQLSYPVDGRGVIFSGATREVYTTGLTRPHSARFYGPDLWVNNSGYGEIGRAPNGGFEPLLRLPGWTRGLCFAGNIGFVATSRVLPRFKRYAPGLDIEKSTCGIHAIDMGTMKVLGRISWPAGNQIFAVEPVPRDWTLGFPFRTTRGRSTGKEGDLFYSFKPADRFSK